MGLIKRIKCKTGYHNTYSRAEDLGYKLDKYFARMRDNSVEENMLLLQKLSAIRCRHCPYIFVSTRLINITKMRALDGNATRLKTGAR